MELADSFMATMVQLFASETCIVGLSFSDSITIAALFALALSYNCSEKGAENNTPPESVKLSNRRVSLVADL